MTASDLAKPESLTDQVSKVYLPTQREISASKLSEVLERDVSPDDLLDERTLELEGARFSVASRAKGDELSAVSSHVQYWGGRYQFDNGKRRFISEAGIPSEVTNLIDLKLLMKKEDKLAQKAFATYWHNFFKFKFFSGPFAAFAFSLFFVMALAGMVGLFSPELLNTTRLGSLAVMVPAAVYLLGVFLCKRLAKKGLALTSRAREIN
jgi:hypothetical protein